MEFSLSTHWNTYRHGTGEALIEEILALGITRVELGYDFTIDLREGVQKMVAQKAVTVGSLHNYCPVPVGAPMGHPELFTFGDPDRRVRENALWHTRKTIDFAAELGAKLVVAHMGNVDMRQYTRKLLALWDDGRQFDAKYEKVKFKLLTKREKKAPRQLQHIYASLEVLLPHLASTGVRLGIEILPTWEAYPTEVEVEALLNHFNSPYLTYWHDFGHSQIRQNLGLINHAKWLERLGPRLGDVHIHDVTPPGIDHVMPPNGSIDFSAFAPLVPYEVEHVFEPSRRVETEEVKQGMQIVREAWASVRPAAPASPTTPEESSKVEPQAQNSPGRP